MVDHGHGAPNVIADETGGGAYVIDPLSLKMNGLWDVTMKLTPQGAPRPAPCFRSACCRSERELRRVDGRASARILAASAVLAAVASCGPGANPRPACFSTVDVDGCTPLYPAEFPAIFSQVLSVTCASSGASCHGDLGRMGGLVLVDEAAAYAALLGLDGARPRVIPGDVACSEMMVRLDLPGHAWSMPPGAAPRRPCPLLDPPLDCGRGGCNAEPGAMSRRAVVAALTLAIAGAACGDDQPASRPRAELLDPLTCKECHAKHYDEWSGSVHAYASRDPVFLALNRRGQEETAGALGSFCVKCHAPMAVAEGAPTASTWRMCQTPSRASDTTPVTTSAASTSRTTMGSGCRTTPPCADGSPTRRKLNP